MTAEPPAEEGRSREGVDRFERWAVPVAAVTSAMLTLLFLLFGVVGTLGLPFAGVPVVRVAHRKGLGPSLVAALLAAGVLTGASLLGGSTRELAGPLVTMGLLAGLPA